VIYHKADNLMTLMDYVSCFFEGFPPFLSLTLDRFWFFRYPNVQREV